MPGTARSRRYSHDRTKINTNNNGVVSFAQGIVSVIGEGIDRYFMVPYNEQWWRTDLNLYIHEDTILEGKAAAEELHG